MRLLRIHLAERSVNYLYGVLAQLRVSGRPQEKTWFRRKPGCLSRGSPCSQGVQVEISGMSVCVWPRAFHLHRAGRLAGDWRGHRGGIQRGGNFLFYLNDNQLIAGEVLPTDASRGNIRDRGHSNFSHEHRFLET